MLTCCNSVGSFPWIQRLGALSRINPANDPTRRSPLATAAAIPHGGGFDARSRRLRSSASTTKFADDIEALSLLHPLYRKRP